jgi:flagellar motility protein MotE (MotC chaperone)
MRNSSCNSVFGQLFVRTAVAAAAMATVAGVSVSAEEMKQTPSTVVDSRSNPLSSNTITQEHGPEIAALYEKYGGYCDAIVDEARERRYALKRCEIERIADELQKRIAAAEAQSAVLEKWVTRREEFAQQATAKIVEIYANMQPEASAARLQQLDINLAASLLLAIPPRKASPILNEMDEKNAAAITAIMAASARVEDPS